MYEGTNVVSINLEVIKLPALNDSYKNLTRAFVQAS